MIWILLPQAPVDQGHSSGSALQPNIIVDDFIPWAILWVQVDFDLAVQTQGDDDSSLWSLTNMTSNDDDMVLDDLDVQWVSTGSTFFRFVVEDI